jgi:hypothetical protein
MVVVSGDHGAVVSSEGDGLKGHWSLLVALVSSGVLEGGFWQKLLPFWIGNDRTLIRS